MLTVIRAPTFQRCKQLLQLREKLSYYTCAGRLVKMEILQPFAVHKLAKNSHEGVFFSRRNKRKRK